MSDETQSKPKAPVKKESFIQSLLSLFIIIFSVFGFKSSILDANNIPSGSMLPTLKIGDFLFVNKMRYSFRMPYTEKELVRYDDPKRGDIVTFDPPSEAIHEEGVEISGGAKRRPDQLPIIGKIFAKRFVKRVIGVPGDELRFREKSSLTSRGDFVSYTVVEFKEKGSTEFKSFRPTPVPHGKELTDLDNSNAFGKALFVEEKLGFKHFVLEGETDSNNRSKFVRSICTDGVCKIPEDHYLVMGDNRDDSHDSRYWGLVPRSSILGKALIIYFSIDWKDFTCRFKEIPEENTYESVEKELLSGAELESRCSGLERSSSDILSYAYASESMLDWFKRTLEFRIWRMKIRWKRIGKILE